MANLVIKNGSNVAEIRSISVSSAGPVVKYEGCVGITEYVSFPLKAGVYKVSVVFIAPPNLEGQQVFQAREIRMENTDMTEVFAG
ncbi:MAG: hypothetical protein LBC31_05300 [Treponema sp.]|jgi:hypothetical protein|nr:hypothetical protein [Treponema sp.]